MLLLALTLGALRFIGLDAWSLWLDEAYTLADARHGTGILNPVGYRIFGWIYALGAERPSEFLLRLPAAVFGWLSIPLTAWGLALFVGRRPAAFAALFVALSPWHLYWSQNARFYTLAQSSALLGCTLVYAGVLRGSILRVVLGVGALAAAAGCHPSAGLLAAAVLTVPWILRACSRWPESSAELAHARRGWRALGWIVVAALATTPLWILLVLEKWGDRHLEGTPLLLLKSSGYLMSPFLGLAFAFGALEILRAGSKVRRAEFTLLATTVAGLGTAFAASFFVRVSAQYVFVFLPFVAAIAALPLRRGRFSKPIAALYLGLVALPLAVESGLYFGVRHGDRPQWREAYGYVFEHKRPGDLVLGMDAPIGEYYWNPTSDDLRNLTMLEWADSFRARVPSDWARYERRVWFVINSEQLYDWSSADRLEMNRMLREDCIEVATYLVPYHPRDLDVHVYLRDGGR